MFYVFLVYGLAFFLLGSAVFIYPKRGSDFPLARRILWIGAFGIVHGISEWVDLALLSSDPSATALLKALNFVILPLSFGFLLIFAAVTFEARRPGLRRAGIFLPDLPTDPERADLL